MPDDHSKLVPPLPIPNRTVKRLCADDSAATSVKVGYRQACYKKTPPATVGGVFALRDPFVPYCPPPFGKSGLPVNSLPHAHNKNGAPGTALGKQGEKHSIQIPNASCALKMQRNP